MRLRTSPAAEFQSIQTRAIMGATLWSRAASTVFLAWIVLTLAVIWHQASVDHHAYFGRWILCGILNDTPLLNAAASRLPMYADGGWYELPSFVQWLNSRAMYGDSFYGSFWHTAIGWYGLGTCLFPVACLLLISAWRWQRDPDGSEHLRGLRLLSPSEHNRSMHGGTIRRMLHGQPDGIRLGETIIPERTESEHFLITGNPGSGKTTAMRSMLIQIQERGQPAIVIDPESEYVQQFYNPGRGDWILNPLDGRCPYWTPWAELRGDDNFPVDAASMAASLFRGRPRTNSERFFLESTRTVIEAIFGVMREHPNTEDLLRFVSLDRDVLHQALAGTPAYPIIDPKAAEQGSGVLGTAANAIKTFAHLPRRDDADRVFSARQWAQHRQGWIFLTSREDLRDAIEPLQGLWLDCLVRWLMSAEIGSDQVWIMADELASLGHQPQIEKVLTRGRKRGRAVVMGLQNVSQLRAIYGPEGAITMTSSPSTKLILRVDETETAKWASDLIGSHEVERLQMTQLTGLSTYREGVNLQPHRSVQLLVLPDEIKLLPPFTGYLCIAGYHRTTIEIPQVHLIRNHPDFVPRTRTKPPQNETIVVVEPSDDTIIAQIAARP